MIDQLDRTNTGPPKRDCQSKSQALDLPTTIQSQVQRVSLFMLGRKKGSGSSSAANGTDYITSLIAGHLPSAAPGHSIELGLDATRDLLSIIFDETRIYFNDGVMDPGVIVMGLQAPLFLDFVPSPDLIGELMLNNKVLISTNLIPVSETNFDLVISADLLLTGHPAEDGVNLAIILECISVAHNELYDAWESL